MEMTCYNSFYFGCFINWYFKLIGWIIERRKCATAGGDQASLIGNCNPCVREILCIVT